MYKEREYASKVTKGQKGTELESLRLRKKRTDLEVEEKRREAERS